MPGNKNFENRNEEMERELKDIYMKDGKMPDFKKFERARGSKTRLFLIGMVAFFAVLAASAWAGFFILKPYERFGGKGVNFEITGPSEIVSGQEAELELFFTNKEDVPLADASLSIFANPGFIMKSSDKEQNEKGTWEIGTVNKGETGKIKISGIIIGAVDEKFTLTASFAYRPANFNSEFEKIANYTTNVKSTVLDISAEGPSEAAPGSEVEFKIKYRNTTSEKLEKVAVAPVLSEAFAITSSEPEIGKKQIWVFDSLEPEEEKELKLRGAYSSEVSGDIAEKFQVGFMTEEEKFISQKEAVVPMKILKSDFVLTLLVNGGRGGPVNFGSALNFLLTFKNEGKDKLGDIVLKAVFEPRPLSGQKSPLAWESAVGDYGARKKVFELSWDKTNFSRLAELAPGEEGSVNFSVNVVGKPYAGLAGEYEISVWVEALVGKKGSETVSISSQSGKINLPVNTNLSFSVESRYFNDDNIAVGSGPVPPRIGEKTSYKIFWKLGSREHDLENIVVSAGLPAGVSWENISFTEKGKISYDSSARKVYWRIDSLPKDAGEAEANFSVAITPSSADSGRVPDLLGATNLEAKDKTTGGAIILSSPALDANLKGDPEAEGRGVVR